MNAPSRTVPAAFAAAFAIALWVSGCGDLVSPAAPGLSADPPDSVAPPVVASQSDPAAVEEPERVPPPDALTILRARCVLPAGVTATEAAAWFRADPEDSNLNYPASIDGDVVTVQAPFGRGELSVLVAGCVIESQMVDAPDGRTSDVGPFVLRRAVPLRGRVLDEDGQPVSNAFVYPKVGEHSVALTGTDEDGRFEFDGLPEGTATLRVECKTRVRRLVSFEHVAGGEPVEIVLATGVVLRGRVLDEHGDPVDSVYASVTDTAAPEDRSRMAFPHIADDGTFEVRVAEGRYRVSTFKDGRNASETIDVVADRTAHVTLRFAPR